VAAVVAAAAEIADATITGATNRFPTSAPIYTFFSYKPLSVVDSISFATFAFQC